MFHNSGQTPGAMGCCQDSKRKTLEPGDAVRFDCGKIQHWAVYVGNGDVAHMTANGVLRQNIMQVANENPFYKDNSFDKKQRPFMTQGILDMARTRLGDKSYNLLTNNCESFVNQVRCGNAKSQQVEKYLKKHHLDNFEYTDYGPNGTTQTTHMTTGHGHVSHTSSVSTSSSAGQGHGQQGHVFSSVTGNGTATATSTGPKGTMSSISSPGGTVYAGSPNMGAHVTNLGPPARDIHKELFCHGCHPEKTPTNRL
ncbi:uncharacterized protein LOC121376978 [Gigantopelta aegis]|uniref:uncharacterized protein LOC121376978 n=1 Tax=Gigantopelta aegis TaxID=1735272 RepID=UPI001B88C012|nr:uncharacterized protein LOC121376978 [Gigantopelta aegis]